MNSVLLNCLTFDLDFCVHMGRGRSWPGIENESLRSRSRTGFRLGLARTVTLSVWPQCSIDGSFYPRDAMLAQVLAMALCVSLCLSLCLCLCLSVTRRFSIKTVERIEWFLAWNVSSSYVTLRVLRKYGYLQNEGTSLWNFVRNSRLRKFRHGISIVETYYYEDAENARHELAGHENAAPYCKGGKCETWKCEKRDSMEHRVLHMSVHCRSGMLE